ncbi:MAG: BREX system P-loop protein BrxC [Lewinellaceae bacterium]|nr:BREX system P-loop protein BrxC [Saprospiraceae bacterium]MCB9338999.1 BREX system P-loop protein BrxC [Lewinellaceae bacterium]
MKLREIYDRPIDRTINPAVVVSNKSLETIKAEISEYIFTDELIEKLYAVLDAIFNKRNEKTGIWINGYYGSGKSHFIKFIHYCLNPDTQQDAFERYIHAVEKYQNTKPGANMDITASNIALLKKKIQSAAIDNILFNVEDETDDGSGERLTRIFLNMFNKFRGYNSNDIPLALLFEKYLDEKGKFAEFKALVAAEMGHNWEQDAADIAAYELESILELAKRLVPEMDIVSLHAKLSNPDAVKIGINATLIPELKKFLDGKDKSYRLLFLVDEVSQYIGTNKEILLNFQNIIERVSEDCNNQVWIACTAQQTLDEVSQSADGTTDVQDEFGKILGRFDTRISLQSNDASYITQRRVLDKNSKGIEELTTVFRQNKDYILNQFKITHELYKGYQGEEDFFLSYPFVPYQFKLIAHVFEAFQHLKYVIKEVKDNERSVLGITHFTAKSNADKEVSYFIPFDGFYNQQFHTNLTQRGSRAIQNGLELTYVKENPFAQRVVKALFMISNLLETQRQTFPSNLDNLTVLLMTELDQNKMQLRNRIKDVLDKLMEESIIREEKGSYFFFNEDEMDVQNLIKSQTIGFDDRLERFDGFFRKMTGLRNKVSYGTNDFKVGYSVDGKEFLRGGDFNVLVLLNDKTTIAQKALDLSKSDLAVCINEWFSQDEQLCRDFEWYSKTKKFFTTNGEDATGERSKTIELFRLRNENLEKKITARLEQKFTDTRYISEQRIVEPDQIKGSNPADRMNDAIEKHLSRIYKNHKLSEGYAQNQKALKESAVAPVQTTNFGLTPAEEVVNNMISSYNDQMTVQDLVREFEKTPFGWRHEALLDVLVHLVKKKRREFKYSNQPRYPIVDFINKAVNTAERVRCEVCSGEEIDQATIDQALLDFREIFNYDLHATTDSDELFNNLKAAFKKEIEQYQPFEDNYHGTYLFGIYFHNTTKLLNNWANIRDPKALFTTMADVKASAKKLLDNAKGMAEFATDSAKDYDAIRKFHEANKENFLELSPDEQEKADKMADFLKMDDPRREYRHIRKAYDEVKKALHEMKAALVEEVFQLYSTIFDELEKEKAALSVTEANVYADRDHTLHALKRLDSIAQLKNKKLDAANFKSRQIEALVKHASEKPRDPSNADRVGEPEVYYISNIKATISNEAEMEAYLTQARREMLELLKQNKTIILK